MADSILTRFTKWLLEPQTFDWSPSDPAFAEWLQMNGMSPSNVTEDSVMGLSAVYRSQALIAGTIATLPLRVYEGTKADRTEVESWLSESPAGPFDTSSFSWIETIVLHLLNHGEAFLKPLKTEGGVMLGALAIHPLAIKKVEWDGFNRKFTIAMQDGSEETLSTGELFQILGMTMDGTRGISPLSALRQTFQTSLAGEKAANRQFAKGALIAGIVTTQEGEDVDPTEAGIIKADLNQKVAGVDNAGAIAFVNRALKFTPWTMTNADAQFIESRGLQVEEVARIYGVPINLLSVKGAISNWGTGIAESNLGLQKYTLMPWTSRIESALKPLLEPGQFCEFDFKGLLAGSPADEIGLLIEQVGAGLLTKDEARGILNLPPLPDEAPPVAPPPIDSEEGE